MKTRRLTVAMAMPQWLEYATWLMEGAITYVEDHPELSVQELPMLDGKLRAIKPGPFPYYGLLAYAPRNDQSVLDVFNRGGNVVNCSSDFMDTPISCVAGGESTRLAADYMASLGRDHVVCIHPKTAELRTASGHLKRFARQINAHGLDCTAFEYAPPVDGVQFEHLADVTQQAQLADFLRKLPKPAAIWCMNDYLGVLTVNVANHIGIAIPDELAVLGAGGYRVARCSTPPLSTIPIPGREIGARAMELLHAIVQNRTPRKGAQLIIPCRAVLERGSTKQSTPHADVAGRVADLIRAHACEGITVNELARHVGVSRVTLTKHFELALGHSPSEEIRRVRIEQAKRWLLEHNLTIVRISGLCGFREQSKFYNFFKRETGLSPTEFRQANTRM